MCIIAIIFSAIIMNGQETAQGILNDAVSHFKKDAMVAANIQIHSANGVSNGELIVYGNRFKISSPSFKCWFNGKVQWSYSTATDEVNITNPTTEELQTTNPYAIIDGTKSNYKSTLIASKKKDEYIVNLSPINTKQQIKDIRLYIAKSSLRLTKVIVVMKDKSTYTSLISNYRSDCKYPQSIFNFNKKEVPNGTHIVDLR